MPVNFYFSIHHFPSCNTDTADVTTAHAADHFQFIWIEKGKGRLLIDTTSEQVEAGTVCFVRPGQVHQLIERDNLQGILIAFNETFLQSGETEFSSFYHARHFQALGCILSIGEETKSILKDIIEKMNKEYIICLPYGEDLWRRYFKIFLLYVFRESERKNQVPVVCKGNQLVQQFLQLVNKQFLEKKRVTEYAAQLSVTANYLNDITKQITGHTAGYHIRQRVLMEIQRKMIYTPANMKEIAYSLGFIDPAHFSKYFKSITGMNFSEYKSILTAAA